MTIGKTSDATLHQRILSEIEQKITSGDWPPGHRMPFELDLAEHYGCSRMTVNKVMTQLAKAGLIERRKKSGSFVSQPRSQSAVLEIHDIETEVRALGLEYAYEIGSFSVRRAIEDDLAKLDVSPGDQLAEVSCLHRAAMRPFCLEQRLINLKTVPAAAKPDFSQLSPGAWLLKVIPWSAAEHRIFATGASVDVARCLEIARNEACLVVERRTWSHSGAVTYVRFTYPGDRHALVARFAPVLQ